MKAAYRWWKRISIGVGVLVLALLATPAADAQIRPLNQAECGFFGIFCPAGVQGATPGTVGLTILLILNASLVVVGAVAAAFLVYAGIRYISSQGDEEQAASAKRQITYAVIGLFVVLLRFFIIDVFDFQAGTFDFIPLRDAILTILNAAMILVGVIASVFLVYAGMKYITSQGDEEEAAKAKRQVTYAVIGLMVVLVRFLIPAAFNFVNDTVQFVDTAAAIRSILNAFTVLVGVVASVFLVYAGVRYITSQGDEEQAAAGKRQIAYALIGLTVVLLRFMIPGSFNFVLDTVNFAGQQGLEGALISIVNAFTILIGVTAAAFLVYAAVRYITSGGDEEQAAAAKRQVVYAVLGLTLVLLRFLIPASFNFVANTVSFGGPQGLEAALISIVNAFTILIGIIATIFLIYAGLRYIMSGGEEDEAAAAKRQIFYAVLGLVIVLLRFLIPAAFTITVTGGSVQFGTLSAAITTILNAFMVLIGILTLIFLIYGGVRYVTSQGDENEAAAARLQITYAVIGLVVVGLAAALVNFVAQSFG